MQASCTLTATYCTSPLLFPGEAERLLPLLTDDLLHYARTGPHSHSGPIATLGLQAGVAASLAHIYVKHHVPPLLDTAARGIAVKTELHEEVLGEMAKSLPRYVPVQYCGGAGSGAEGLWSVRIGARDWGSGTTGGLGVDTQG